MRVFARFVRAYPRDRLAIVLAMVTSGALEGISYTALVPVAILFFSGDAASAIPAATLPGRFVTHAVQRLGFTPGITSLLSVFFAFTLVKSGTSLIANRMVGYTVSRVATDLRLRLLRALLSARWEYFLRQPLGRLANAVSWEADRAAGTYFQGATMVAAAIQLAACTAVAMLLSWRATLLYLAEGLVSLFLNVPAPS